MSTVPAPLAGRYRFSRRVQAGTRTIAWLAIDEHTGAEVVASPLTGPRFAGLLRALGVEHPHLTPIVDLIKDPDPNALPVTDTTARVAGVGLAEYLPGRTLHEELKSGPLEPEDAVTIIVHVAEALSELHRAGAVHGAISPRSIVVSPPSNRLSPVLTQLIAPTSGAYSAPERLRGHGPSAEDDVWALYATLHASLVAGVPFSGTTREELVENMLAGKLRPIAEFGLEDAQLQELLGHGMTAARMQRQTDVRRLEDLLVGWLRDNGYVERDSVVSARQDVSVMHTEPPVSVYEDDDMTRVFVRGAPDLSSVVAWPGPPGVPSGIEPGPPSERKSEPSQNGTASEAGSDSQPTSAPLAMLHAAPAPAMFPKAPRARLQSIHLDPFAETGFTEPAGDKAASTEASDGTASDAAAAAISGRAPSNEAAESEQTAPSHDRKSSEGRAPLRPPDSAPVDSALLASSSADARPALQATGLSGLDRSEIIRLAIMGILIGMAVTTCIALTR
jgi:serine/threonine protein kinase